MANEVFKKAYSSIGISVCFFGMFFEFWYEYPYIGQDSGEFLRQVRDKYRIKFPNQTFRLRLIYSDEYFEVTKDSIKPVI